MKIGDRHSEETKEKNRLSHLGKKYKPMSEEGRENIRQAHLGYKIKDETKKKLSEALMGHKCPESVKQLQRELKTGVNNPQWKGGVTTKNEFWRKSNEYKEWRRLVFERDGFICQKTKENSHSLHPHHIQNFATNEELRFDVSNGITLCEKAHREFHKIYGSSNNTLEQLLEFLNK